MYNTFTMYVTNDEKNTLTVNVNERDDTQAISAKQQYQRNNRNNTTIYINAWNEYA